MSFQDENESLGIFFLIWVIAKESSNSLQIKKNVIIPLQSMYGIRTLIWWTYINAFSKQNTFGRYFIIIIVRMKLKQLAVWYNIWHIRTGNPCFWACWRHQMETFYALLALCAGNSPVTGEFSTQRPVTRSFDVFCDLRLNKRSSKQS